MKPLKLIQRKGFDDFLQVVKNSRKITVDGKVQLHDFGWEDAPNVLSTFFKHDTSEDLDALERTIRDAIFSVDLPIDFSLQNLIDVCEKIRTSEAKKKRRKYTILSGMTSFNGIDFSDFESTGVEVSFSVDADLMQAHRQVVEEHLPETANSGQLFRLVAYAATIHATDIEKAFENARRTVDVWRGAVNLAKNISKYGRSSSGRSRQPLNEFLNSQFSTVLDENYEINRETLFYYSDWEGPRSIYLNGVDPVKLTNKIDRFISYTNNSHGLSTFAQDLLVKYVRACDSPNWHYSFLELWTILEQACCIQPGQDHRKIVERVCSLYKHKEQTSIYLDHLRLQRNSVIHKGYEQKDHTSERMLFQLNRYVSQVLFLLLANKLDLKNKNEWESFLDFGETIEQLKIKRRILDKAIAFKGGDPED